MLLSKGNPQTVFLLSALLGFAGLAWWHTLPPLPSRNPASLGQFSAIRAMSHVAAIGSKPHPTGSSEITNVRNYLTNEIVKLGLQPEIQSTLIVSPQKHLAGKVTNILTKIPGTTPGKALLLAAHYDSVPTGPGAADDGASVAAILETLRALKTLPPLANDIICLFTDGEEIGLLGAEAFVKQHPWAKHINVALNFEYRGNRGAFMMFETSPGNGKLIENLAKSVPFVLANSLMYEVYKFLPNDTDFTVFKNAGIPGMNFAAIEGYTDYHTMLDRPEFLDKGSLQHEGEIMLALVKQFGITDLEHLQAKDRVYFDVPVFGLINYPVAWLLPLQITLGLVFAVVMYSAIKSQGLRLPRVLIGIGWFTVMLLTLPIAAQLLWFTICKLHPQYNTFTQGDTYNSHWYLLAFISLLPFLFCLALAFITKWLRPLEFTFAVMTSWLALSYLSAIWLPGASYLLLWPLLVMVLAIGIMLRLNHLADHPVNTLLLILGSIPAIFLYVPLVKSVFIGLTPHFIGVVVALLILPLGLLTLIINRINQSKGFSFLMLTVGLAALVIGSLTSGFNNQHPQQNSLFYAENPGLKQAFWLSKDYQLDEWTKSFFPGQTEKRLMPEFFGQRKLRFWSTKAPLANLLAPTITILDDITVNQVRHLNLRIKSQMNSPKMELWTEGAEILNSSVAGVIYTHLPNKFWHLDAFGLANTDLPIELTLKPNTPFTFRASNINYNFPISTNYSRPPNTIPKPGNYSDVSYVVGSYNF